MRLFRVKYHVQCGDMLFDDQMLVPGKAPADARSRFEHLANVSKALLGTPVGFAQRVLYALDVCQIQIKKIEAVNLANAGEKKAAHKG